MAVTFRSVATDITNSKTVSKPTGTVDGDVLVLIVNHYDNTGATVTPPAGFTSRQSASSSNGGGSQVRTEIFTKVASSEGSSYSVTISDGGYTDLILAAYSGADTGSHYDTGGSASESNGGSSPINVTAGANTSVDDSRAVVAFSGYSGSSFSTPAGYTNRVHDLESSTNDLDDGDADTGSAATAGSTYGGGNANAVLVVIKCAGGGGGGPAPGSFWFAAAA